MSAPLLETTTGDSIRAEVLSGIWLDARRAVWFAAEQLLVVADLHWGYAASHQARGHLLPPWGDDELAGRLDALLRSYPAREMLWLGDVVHAAEGSARAEAYLRQARVPIAHLAGNHDRRWRARGASSITRGRFFFHHGDTPHTVPPGAIEVIGHHHPAATWHDGAGGRLKLPALVASPRRLVLPAFSPWAPGTAWSHSRDGDETLWLVGPNRIFPLPRAAPARISSAA